MCDGGDGDGEEEAICADGDDEDGNEDGGTISSPPAPRMAPSASRCRQNTSEHTKNTLRAKTLPKVMVWGGFSHFPE